MKKPASKILLTSTILVCSPVCQGIEDLEGSANNTPLPTKKELLGKLSIPDGMKAELFATTPNVQNPTAITFDDKGRLYVAETHRFDRGIEDNRRRQEWMRDEMRLETVDQRKVMYKKYETYKPMSYYSKYSEKIRLLEDSNGDGIADKAKLYADGFNNALDGTAAGIFAYNGSIYFTCIPNLWKLEDTDGDDVADKKTVLQRGFGVSVSLSGHDMNGCAMGPDGRIYFSIGDRGYNFRTKEGKDVKDIYAGAVFRCWPDGSEIEVVHEGLRNPKEIAFDKYGRLFSVDNNADMGDKARLVYIVEGGDSGWHRGHQNLNNFKKFTDSARWHRTQWMSDKYWKMEGKTRPFRILPPSGFVSKGPSGLAYYPGLGLAKEWDDSFFVCDYIGARSSIIGFKIAEDGAGFKVDSPRKFVSGFLTTDVEFGYDGRVYSSDYEGSWPTYGFGNIFTFSNPEALKSKEVKEVAGLFRQGFAGLKDARLVQLLSHGDMRVRQRAQFELAKRNKVEELSKVAQEGKKLEARLHGVWGLGNIARKGGELAVKELEALLSADESKVRGQVAKILGSPKVQYTDSSGKLKSLLKDADLNVRMLAAVAYGGKMDRPAVTLLDSLRKVDEDPYLRHGVVEGIVRSVRLGKTEIKDLLKYVGEDDIRLRESVLLVLGRLKSENVALFLRDPSDKLQRESIQMINDKELVSCETALAESKGLLGKFGQTVDLRIMNAIVRAGNKSGVKRLLEIASDEEQLENIRREAMRSLGIWNKPPVMDPTNGRFRPMKEGRYQLKKEDVKEVLTSIVESSTGNVLADAFAATKLTEVEISSVILLSKLLDEKAPDQVRQAALQIFVKTAEVKKLLGVLEKLTESKSFAMRKSAIAALGEKFPAVALPKIKELYARSSVRLSERQHALVVLGNLNNAKAKQWLKELYNSIEKQAPELKLDIYMAMKSSANDELKKKIENAEAKQSLAEKFRYSLIGGDRGKGANVFYENGAIACLQCHQAGKWGQGGTAGPRLNTLGAKGPKYILEAIIDPGGTIAPNYATISLTMHDGSVIVGTYVKSDASGVTIINKETNAPYLVESKKIKSKSKLTSSMPSIGPYISAKDMRDLISYFDHMGKPEDKK